MTALQGAGLKVLCDAVLNHRCAHNQARRPKTLTLTWTHTGPAPEPLTVILTVSPAQYLVSAWMSTGCQLLFDTIFRTRVHIITLCLPQTLYRNPRAAAQDQNGVWNQFGGRLAWDATAIVSDDAHFRGKGNRSTGDSFGAAPNIDHSQEFVRRDIAEWMQWLRTHAGYDGWRCAPAGNPVGQVQNASVSMPCFRHGLRACSPTGPTGRPRIDVCV